MWDSVWAGMDPAACVRVCQRVGVSVCVCVSVRVRVRVSCVCCGGFCTTVGGTILRTRSRATSPRASSGGALGYSQRGTQGVLRVLTGTITTHAQPSHQPESQLVQTRDLSCAGAHQLTEYSRGTQRVLKGYSRRTKRVLTGYRVGTLQWGSPFTSAESCAQVCAGLGPFLAQTCAGVSPFLVQMSAGVSPFLAQMRAGVSPFLVQMGAGVSPFWAQMRAGVSPVVVQMGAGVSPFWVQMCAGVGPVCASADGRRCRAQPKVRVRARVRARG